ncbi:hypothetical protein Tco_1372881, partial [Tanacetum coccineum]
MVVASSVKALPSQQQRRNTLQCLDVVLKSFGSATMSSTHGLSTSTFDTISLRLMKMKFNRLLNLIWMIMSTIYNKTTRKLPVVEVKGKGSATDRWIIASQDETTGPSVHPEDATSTKMVRETLSHADAESGGNSEKINSETDTEILNVGSNSKQSHVALAGPNPEHMQDVFLATNYPKVLKRQKKLRNQISSALTGSADVPSS